MALAFDLMENNVSNTDKNSTVGRSCCFQIECDQQFISITKRAQKKKNQNQSVSSAAKNKNVISFKFLNEYMI